MVNVCELGRWLVSESERGDHGQPANVVDGLFAIAGALTFAAKHLGKEDASDPQGCLEFLAGQVADGSKTVAQSIDGLAAAVDRLADVARQVLGRHG